MSLGLFVSVFYVKLCFTLEQNKAALRQIKINEYE